ncbi:heterokaryon incompatibility protein-domain-containing protein [Podospora aff. communis PSN243]|uniref:Heterokaryon incompatibility protein-domain-containing protein n=1 Tax=Podospora aff. communis PSN243 TaxID=3040156 RepID=A0AAV9GNA1_9PEZI|nr:heterokaryon incompatibility protein-domain-containing protein [Podospora aff. communis PSN243]
MLTDSEGVDFRFNPLAGLDRARDWLQACLKDHKCRSSAPGLLPSRIIDVCSGSESDIRLLTTTPGTRGCYAALSYCWGAGHDASYLTTTANLQQRQAGFPVDILPRTLRDAVRVTRRLRLRYLWVDAICILQGTDEHARADWTAESGRMADVYSLATVTISATASDHCNGGLAYGMACRVAIGSGKARQLVQLDLTTDGRGYMLEETRGLGARTAIITRAWTLQEHVLSSRILYFTAYGLQWECEGAYVGSPGGRWHTSPKYNLKIFVRKKEPFRRLWADLVANYTLRKLSNSEDKLPAFAAVAKTMHILSGDTYLAGLWKRDLIAHLLWTTKVYGDLRGAQERPVAYRAPSWSWMSLDAAVSLEYKLDQMEVSVIESCHVTPVNPEDPFGQVTGGVLIMRGPTARITRIRGLRIYTNFKQSEYRLGEAVFDTPRDESEARQALEGTTSDIVAIVLQYRRQGNTYALMLAPVTEQGQPTQRYRRIGVVTWFKEVAYARESDWKMEEVPTDKLPVRKFVII